MFYIHFRKKRLEDSETSQTKPDSLFQDQKGKKKIFFNNVKNVVDKKLCLLKYIFIIKLFTHKYI